MCDHGNTGYHIKEIIVLIPALRPVEKSFSTHHIGRFIKGDLVKGKRIG